MRQKNKIIGRLKDLRDELIKGKKWWMVSLLFVLILFILIVLYLLKYQQTEFVYSLF